MVKSLSEVTNTSVLHSLRFTRIVTSTMTVPLSWSRTRNLLRIIELMRGTVSHLCLAKTIIMVTVSQINMSKREGDNIDELLPTPKVAKTEHEVMTRMSRPLRVLV